MIRYTVPEGVAVVTREGSVFVAKVPDGPVMVLQGSAADLWHLVPGTTRQSLPAVVSMHFGVAESALVEEVGDFVASLLAHGLLLGDGP